MGVHRHGAGQLASADLAVARARLQLFHQNPTGHHFTSLLIHAANAVLLFLLLVYATGRVGPSLFVAALFALHPINVESVAWVAERKNVLSTFFFLAALIAYGWYARKPDWRRYLAFAGLFALGLMSKPMVITLPFVLLLLDYWPLGRIEGSPSEAADSASAAVQAAGREIAAARSFRRQRRHHHAGAAGRRRRALRRAIFVRRASGKCGGGLRHVLVEDDLAVASGATLSASGRFAGAWQIVMSALVLLAVTAVVLRFRSRRYLLTGWLWFLGTLVPVIGLVQVGDQAMADRYAYIPLIGIFVMIAWGAADLADSRQIGFSARMIPAACVLLALSFATHRQLGLLVEQLRPMDARAGRDR